MTAMDTRRTVGVPLFLLPLALIVALFEVSVLLARIAPSLASGGVYQVTVGKDATCPDQTCDGAVTLAG